MLPIIRLAKEIAFSNFTELKRPYKLTCALTYQCEFRCGMCGIWKRKPLQELTAGQFSEFFRKSGGFSWINLTGGEIFLRPDLLDIIGAIHRYCKSVYLLNFPTNGHQTGEIEGCVRTIISSFRFPRVLVTVSLDGPPELHDSIRSMPGSWNRAIETYQRLRRLRSRGFDVFFGMTLQDANAGSFPETVQAVRERINDIRYRDFHVNIMHVSDHYYGNAESGHLTARRQIIDQLRGIERLRGAGALNPVSVLEQRYQKMAAYYVETGKPPAPCQALAASCFVDPAGTVYPCTSFDKPIGNIVESGYELDGLWDSETRRSIRQEIRAGNCPQCWTPCEAYQNILARVLRFTAR